VGRRASIAVVVIALIGGALYYFVFYRPPRAGTDREQILRMIVDVQKSVEQGRVSGVMDHIAEDYSDSHGLNRRMVQRLVLAGAREHRGISLSVQVPDVEVSGDEASFVARVDYSVGGGEMVHLTVNAKLRREKGRWMVVSADGWQGAEAAYY